MTIQWRIQGRAKDACLAPIFFIFMQFLAKGLKNKLAHSGAGALPMRNPESATEASLASMRIMPLLMWGQLNALRSNELRKV